MYKCMLYLYYQAYPYLLPKLMLTLGEEAELGE